MRFDQPVPGQIFSTCRYKINAHEGMSRLSDTKYDDVCSIQNISNLADFVKPMPQGKCIDKNLTINPRIWIIEGGRTSFFALCCEGSIPFSLPEGGNFFFPLCREGSIEIFQKEIVTKICASGTKTLNWPICLDSHSISLCFTPYIYLADFWSWSLSHGCCESPHTNHDV